jgi:hypothetical protein
MTAGGWGPFAPYLGPCERAARLRELRAVARLVAGPDCPLMPAIGRALSAPGGLDAIDAALASLPALTRRRVLAAYAAIARERAGKGWDMTEMQAANSDGPDPLADALRRTRADVIARMRASAIETGRVDAGWTTLLASLHTALATIEADTK